MQNTTPDSEEVDGKAFPAGEAGRFIAESMSHLTPTGSLLEVYRAMKDSHYDKEFYRQNISTGSFTNDWYMFSSALLADLLGIFDNKGIRSFINSNLDLVITLADWWMAYALRGYPFRVPIRIKEPVFIYTDTMVQQNEFFKKLYWHLRRAGCFMRLTPGDASGHWRFVLEKAEDIPRFISEWSECDGVSFASVVAYDSALFSRLKEVVAYNAIDFGTYPPIIIGAPKTVKGKSTAGLLEYSL